MKKILILGGSGFTGRLVARHLLERTTTEIVLAARNVDKARLYTDQLNGEFNGNRVSAVQADASDAQNLRQILKEINLLVVAAPTTQYAEIVIRAAIDSKTDYLDVQLNAQKLNLLKSYAQDIQRAGLCFITEAGFHPGLPAAMVRYVASHLDRIDTAVTAGYLNFGHSLPYTDAVNELMEYFKNYQAQIFQNRRWTNPSDFQIRQINFGSEIGIRSSYSMFFEELKDLPTMLPTLNDLGFYIAGSHWFVDWVITPIVFAGVKIGPQSIFRPMGKLMWWGMQTFPKPPYIVLLKVEATGLKDGKLAKIVATVSHTDGYELTAIPVVAALQQYLDGSARRPGLWMMGHLVDPIQLFKDMQSMGVRVTSLFI